MQEFKCGTCNLEFKTRSGLWKHIKNKHDKIEVKIFKCKYCNKKLSDRHSKWKHETKVCKKNANKKNKCNNLKIKIDINKEIPNNENEINEENTHINKKHSDINKKLDDIKQTIIQSVPINNQLIDIIVNKNKIIENLTKLNLENELNTDNIDNDTDKNDIIKDKEEQIKILKNLVLKKQKRVQYNDKYVIYILTTLENKKNNVYIIGKAINLTNRLSTYNKTTEHQVVYYKACNNKEDLKMIENMVLCKLKDFKEQANRDRFILPNDKNINFFTEIIDDCINFF
jgi:hypothetical protein